MSQIQKGARGSGEAVFYNFPFDDEYRQLRDAVVFAIVACDFKPVCALDTTGSGQTRFTKILALIRKSRLSIHDLSRTESDKVTGQARFNMPFELGLCVGAQHFDPSDQSPGRECLVLGCDLPSYRACISDLAGNDIGIHNNAPKRAIAIVRDWLDDYTDLMCAGGEKVYRMYQDFQKDLPKICAEREISVEELTYPNYLSFVLDWFALSPTPPKH